jgi:4-oxalocrotonate tautomerase
MPVINVQMLKGRSAEQKRQFIHEMSEVAQRTLLVPEQAITIILTEVEDDHWGKGSKTMAEVKAEASRG